MIIIKEHKLLTASSPSGLDKKINDVIKSPEPWVMYGYHTITFKPDGKAIYSQAFVKQAIPPKPNLRQARSIAKVPGAGQLILPPGAKQKKKKDH